MSADEAAMSEGRSITQLIERLKDKDSQAPGQIWQRFFEKLLPLARAKLQALPDRTVETIPLGGSGRALQQARGSLRKRLGLPRDESVDGRGSKEFSIG